MHGRRVSVYFWKVSAMLSVCRHPGMVKVMNTLPYSGSSGTDPEATDIFRINAKCSIMFKLSSLTYLIA
jgi:hypothetical protein